MTRIEIDLLRNNLLAAYKTDRWHSILNNLGPVTDHQWNLRPAEYSVDVFGTLPELSIEDLATHVAGAFVMYNNKAFGDGTMTWDQVRAPGTDKEAILGWLDANVTAMVEGLDELSDDDALSAERDFFGRQVPVRWLVSVMANHMVYHSGELNRQLSLIRGTSGGWVAAR